MQSETDTIDKTTSILSNEINDAAGELSESVVKNVQKVTGKESRTSRVKTFGRA